MTVPRAAWAWLIYAKRVDHYAVKMGLTLAGVAALWSASSIGYYALVDALGLESGYNEAPILFMFYYLAWTGIALLCFRNVLSAAITNGRMIAHIKAMLPLLAIFAAFVMIILPSLPPVSIWRAPADPPEFMFASGWYYLPKSADILFQQVAVAAIVFTAARLNFRLRTISLGLSLLFGGFHLHLAFEGFLPLYVARFTAAACLFGLIAPYIYLRCQNGFRWAYGLHWSFYALDATITHFVLSAPRWMQWLG